MAQGYWYADVNVDCLDYHPYIPINYTPTIEEMVIPEPVNEVTGYSLDSKWVVYKGVTVLLFVGCYYGVSYFLPGMWGKVSDVSNVALENAPGLIQVLPPLFIEVVTPSELLAISQSLPKKLEASAHGVTVTAITGFKYYGAVPFNMSAIPGLEGFGSLDILFDFFRGKSTPCGIPAIGHPSFTFRDLLDLLPQYTQEIPTKFGNISVKNMGRCCGHILSCHKFKDTLTYCVGDYNPLNPNISILEIGILVPQVVFNADHEFIGFNPGPYKFVARYLLKCSG